MLPGVTRLDRRHIERRSTVRHRSLLAGRLGFGIDGTTASCGMTPSLAAASKPSAAASTGARATAGPAGQPAAPRARPASARTAAAGRDPAEEDRERGPDKPVSTTAEMFGRAGAPRLDPLP